MLIVKIDKGNIEKALKSYKHKVRKTKQIQKLRDEKEYTKTSALKRRKLEKAKYIQHRNNQIDNI